MSDEEVESMAEALNDAMILLSDVYNAGFYQQAIDEWAEKHSEWIEVDE